MSTSSADCQHTEQVSIHARSLYRSENVVAQTELLKIDISCLQGSSIFCRSVGNHGRRTPDKRWKRRTNAGKDGQMMEKTDKRWKRRTNDGKDGQTMEKKDKR